MGYRTPNIDRIADEGMRFTDSYGEQSCTAGRAAYLMGEVDTSPRRGFFYFSDDADLLAMRFENWKVVFMELRYEGTLRLWAEPFTHLRVPKLFNLRTDPFEYADITSNTYYEWFIRRDFFVFYATAMATAFLDTFKEFPPRHEPASFTVDQAVEKLQKSLAHE
jgi:arylsulfatase